MITWLLGQQADDARRIALDTIDENARTSGTFGSQAHRSARDSVERKWDAEQARLAAMTDDQLRQLVEAATPRGEAPEPDAAASGWNRGATS